MREVDIGVLTLAYRDADTIGAVMYNWDGYPHLVLQSAVPWHGDPVPEDRTAKIVRQFPGAKLLIGDWKSETEQRNFGLEYLKDMDYVIIVDADELYTSEAQKTILNRIGQPRPSEDNQNCYRLDGMITYFKDLDHVLEPGDKHQPVIAVRPKEVKFIDCRIPDTQYQVPIKAPMHHLSYVGENRMRHKFSTFEHHDQVRDGWYEDVWENWEHGSDMLVRAYGREESRAVASPAPDEIKLLYEKGLTR